MNRLMRNTLCLLLGVVLALAVVPAFAGHTVRHATTAAVHKMHEPGVSCSAVMIAPERALTAAHCLNMTSPVLTIEGVDYPITEGYAASPRDLAILFVPGAPCPCAVVSLYPSEEGDALLAVGYPYGLARVVTYGEFQARIVLEEDGQEYILTTTLGAPGNSGGGLFNDRGELIGITVKGAPGHSLLAVELTSMVIKGLR